LSVRRFDTLDRHSSQLRVPDTQPLAPPPELRLFLTKPRAARSYTRVLALARLDAVAQL
jgi:hypothetical protein